MAKTNLGLIIFAALIAIVISSPMLKDKRNLNPCHIPEVFCRLEVLQEKCHKKEFCETWPGDGVEMTAVDVWKYWWSDVVDFFEEAGPAMASTP